MTIVDALTGAHNKRYFLEFLEREIARCARYRRPLSLLMFDIDHFKAINDKHGHLTGDYVLREMSRRLLARVRREELLGALRRRGVRRGDARERPDRRVYVRRADPADCQRSAVRVTRATRSRSRCRSASHASRTRASTSCRSSSWPTTTCIERSARAEIVS